MFYFVLNTFKIKRTGTEFNEFELSTVDGSNLNNQFKSSLIFNFKS